ncbi:MAG: hypothetical protein AAF432_04390 [Planctomycetota bacterium]
MQIATDGDLVAFADGGSSPFVLIHRLPDMELVTVIDADEVVAKYDQVFPFNFAQNVALSGDRVIVGAATADIAGHVAGAVFVFDMRTGAIERVILPPAQSIGNYFGSVLACDGNVLLVGNSPNQFATPFESQIFLFDLDTGEFQHELVPGDFVAGMKFGASLHLHGNLVVVGAPDFGERGAVYTFSAATGEQIRRYETFPPAAEVAKFGKAVATNGSIVLVGADNLGLPSAGLVVAIDLQTTDELYRRQSPEPYPSGGFGSLLDMHGNLAAVSAPKEFGTPASCGAVYLLDALTGTIVQRIVAEPNVDAGLAEVEMFGWGLAFGQNAIFASYRDAGPPPQVENGPGAVVVAPLLSRCTADCAPQHRDGSAGNGVVNVDDLIAVINAFGSSDSHCDVTPVDLMTFAIGDGVVNIDDVLHVMIEFGDCPIDLCPTPFGSCCFDGDCVERTPLECAAIGGEFMGFDVDCASTMCPQPVILGACCGVGTGCGDLTEDMCVAFGGIFQGEDVRCYDAPPCDLGDGACCIPDFGCLELSVTNCGFANGLWGGAGSSCDEALCP